MWELGRSDSNHAELVGLLEGLRVIKVKGLNDCIVKGDSRMVISWGVGKTGGFWWLHHVIYCEGMDLIGELHGVLHHILRSQNLLADKLGQWGVEQQGLFIGEHKLDC